jgi:hypothetical protein
MATVIASVSDPVSIAIVSALGLTASTAVPAWLTFRLAKRNKISIDSIKEQVLPNNGTKLWQYAQEARDTSAEALNVARATSLTQEKHELVGHPPGHCRCRMVDVDHDDRIDETF